MAKLFANSGDLDSVASDLGLHHLQITPFEVLRLKWIKICCVFSSRQFCKQYKFRELLIFFPLRVTLIPVREEVNIFRSELLPLKSVHSLHGKLGLYHL